MKIIGKTANGFILEAEKDEVYKLIGFRDGFSATHRERNERYIELKIGDEIQVAVMYSQLYSLVHATDCIRSLQQEALKMAEHLAKHPATPILESVKVGPDK